MRSIFAFAIQAAAAAATLTITLTDRQGDNSTLELQTEELEQWHVVVNDPAVKNKQFQYINVQTDHSEVAACFVSFRSIDKSQWILSSAAVTPTRWWNTAIGSIWCQEHFGLPEWIPEDNI